MDYKYHLGCIDSGQISPIATTTVSSGGNISSDGGTTVAISGVCWSIAANPTTACNKTIDESISGSFSSNLTGLITNTIYYVRAYATNNVGTGYGNELIFVTNALTPLPPTASTAAATLLTNTTGTINGSVNANGSSTIATFEYGLNASYGFTIPAVQNPVNGTALTSVSNCITGLTANQTYHFIVKTVSADGISYGGDISFTTPKH